MATARAAINTLLQVGNGASPESWTTVANVSSISGPGFTSQVEDVTTHSNANPWREKIPTLLDAGELSFEVFFDPSEVTHQEEGTGLMSLFLNRQRKRFKIAFPAPNQTSYYIFEGYVTNFENAFPVDGVITASCTITLTGEPEMSLS